MQPDEGRSPEIVRREDVFGLELHQEALVLVEVVERGRPPREGSRRRAVHPADARPELARPERLEKAELKKDPVDAAAGEHDGSVERRLLDGPRLSRDLHPHPFSLQGAYM